MTDLGNGNGTLRCTSCCKKGDVWVFGFLADSKLSSTGSDDKGAGEDCGAGDGLAR